MEWDEHFTPKTSGKQNQIFASGQHSTAGKQIHYVYSNKSQKVTTIIQGALSTWNIITFYNCQSFLHCEIKVFQKAMFGMQCNTSYPSHLPYLKQLFLCLEQVSEWDYLES